MSKRFLNIAFFLVIVTLVIWSCNPKTVPQKTETIDYSFEDDITQYRPVYELEEQDGDTVQRVIKNKPLEVSFDATRGLEIVIDSMMVKNDSARMVSGYTILVYSGNDEIQAGRVRNRLFDLVPEWDAQFSYKLPTYFVKVGQFYQQIEAQPLYRKIRNYYPTASIVPDKFPIEND